MAGISHNQINQSIHLSIHKSINQLQKIEVSSKTKLILIRLKNLNCVKLQLLFSRICPWKILKKKTIPILTCSVVSQKRQNEEENTIARCAMITSTYKHTNSLTCAFFISTLYTANTGCFDNTLHFEMIKRQTVHVVVDVHVIMSISLTQYCQEHPLYYKYIKTGNI